MTRLSWDSGRIESICGRYIVEGGDEDDNWKAYFNSKIIRCGTLVACLQTCEEHFGPTLGNLRTGDKMTNKLDSQYLAIAQDILDNGHEEPNRTGIPTLGVLGRMIQHDMVDGFPLLTTRKIPIKSVMVELEGFLSGITSKKWYEERDCKFWSAWSNPKAVAAEIAKQPFQDAVDRKTIQKELDDLGAIYGYQWRSFNKSYGDVPPEEFVPGFDQLKRIVDELKTNPSNRQLVCSAWNPNQLDIMALPPCHLSWGVNFKGGRLHLNWHQRSCDWALGVPANIASYGMLLLLLATECDMKPGTLTGFFFDAHLYLNQIDGIKEQLSRTPASTLPKMTLKNAEWADKFDIYRWSHKDYKLTQYKRDDRPIDFGVIAV